MSRPVLLVLIATLALGAAEPVLQAGDRLAVCGDSITEQKQYSRFIAVYLAACQPQLGIDTAQFGWSGERAPGFASRLERSLSWFKPTVATTCYGMNDGSYRAYEDGIGATYRSGMEKVLAGFAGLGVRSVVVGSPGVVDSVSYKRNDPAVYNQNLATLGGIGKELADAAGFPFADVHGAMATVMPQAKAAYGEAYHLAGGDGVHPAANGHLVMAYAFLKALGLDGGIARIELRMDGTATTSEGHRVVEAKAGEVTVESSRYPFLLGGDGKSPNSTASVAPFLPFVEELDRFVLVVPDCPWAQATVTWGEGTLTVSKEELAAGVQLTRISPSPFDRAFQAVDKAAADLQAQETFLVKSVLSMNPPAYAKDDPEFQSAREAMAARLIALRNDAAKALKDAVVPVTHRIAVAEAAAPAPAEGAPTP